MKKIIIAALFAAFACLGISAQKFGSVKADEIFAAMPETTTAQNQLQEAQKKYDAEYQKLQEEFQKKYTEFQQLQQDKETPESILQRRGEELQALDQKAQQFMSQAQQDLQRQQQQLLAPIQEKMMNAIKAVGAEGGYTAIFPVEASLYFGTDVTDVTPTVKTKLGL